MFYSAKLHTPNITLCRQAFLDLGYCFRKAWAVGIFQLEKDENSFTIECEFLSNSREERKAMYNHFLTLTVGADRRFFTTVNHHQPCQRTQSLPTSSSLAE